jgi:hypothetical protein
MIAFQSSAFQADAFQEGAVPVVVGAPALPMFVPAVEQAVVAEDKRRARRRKRERERVTAQAQAVIAIAMADMAEAQRRLVEDDWILGLIPDAQYKEAA